MNAAWKALLLAVAFAATGAAQAGTPYAAAARDAARPLSSEQREGRRFLQEVAARLRLESQAARLALEKSGNPEVRGLAAALLNHHNAVQPELLRLLYARGMAMPIAGNDELRTLKALARLPASRFDRAFIDEIGVRAQQADVAAFERVLAVPADAHLQAWAQRHLPTLRFHLTLADRAGGQRVARARAAPASKIVMVSEPSSR